MELVYETTREPRRVDAKIHGKVHFAMRLTQVDRHIQSLINAITLLLRDIDISLESRLNAVSIVQLWYCCSGMMMFPISL